MNKEKIEQMVPKLIEALGIKVEYKTSRGVWDGPDARHHATIDFDGVSYRLHFLRANGKFALQINGKWDSWVEIDAEDVLRILVKDIGKKAA
jgi:hypothetical protein